MDGSAIVPVGEQTNNVEVLFYSSFAFFDMDEFILLILLAHFLRFNYRLFLFFFSVDTRFEFITVKR